MEMGFPMGMWISRDRVWEKLLNRGDLNGNGEQPAWERELPQINWELVPTDDSVVLQTLATREK